MPKRIALATCLPIPEADPDEEMTLRAFRDAGFACEMLAWDGEAQDLGEYDAVILRSTWNYHLHYVRFTEWLERVAANCRLINPLPIVLGNLHKGYLLKLAGSGVPVVPTHRIRRGDFRNVGDEILAFGWSKIVVKPIVGASSYLTRVFDSDRLDKAQRFVEEHFMEVDALVQPYLQSVERGGERSLVWIDGEFTHKVVKTPRFMDDEISVSAARELSATEIEVGLFAIERYMAIVGDETLLYARVDVMDDDDGRTLVSELELAEPSLFFAQSPGALDRFVAAVARELG